MFADLWLKRVLVPLWVAQLLLNALYIVFGSIVLNAVRTLSAKELEDAYRDHDIKYSGTSEESLKAFQKWSYIYLGIFIGIAGMGVLFSALETVQFARRKLSPVLLVVLNSIAVLVWIVIVGFSAWSAYYSLSVGLIWPVLLFAVYLAKLIYASIILHRVRKGHAGARGSYSVPGEMRTAYDGSTAYHGGAKHAANVEYYSPAHMGPNGRA